MGGKCWQIEKKPVEVTLYHALGGLANPDRSGLARRPCTIARPPCKSHFHWVTSTFNRVTSQLRTGLGWREDPVAPTGSSQRVVGDFFGQNFVSTKLAQRVLQMKVDKLELHKSTCENITKAKSSQELNLDLDYNFVFRQN